MFVGYTTSTKIWKFYNPIKRKSFTSRGVLFYEQERYYGKEGEHAEAKEEEIMVPLRWPARSGGADEYEDKQEEQAGERRVDIWDTERARVERRETDSPLTSVPSEADYHEVSQDRTPEIDDRDADNKGITPGATRYLYEFRSQVKKEVECAVRGLESSLGPAWKPPTSKRRGRTTRGEFSGIAAVRFVDYVNMTVKGPATLGDALRSDEKMRCEGAIREEIENLEAHGTWELVEP